MKFTNTNGIVWYLHCKDNVIGRNKITMRTYYFRKEPNEYACKELPFGYKIIETRSGMPMAKKVV